MVHFIRQVDGEGRINLSNEVFEMGTGFTCEFQFGGHIC